MDSSAYNAWQWVSLSPLPTWVLWSLAVLVAFSAARAIWGLRGEPNRRLRFGLAALRVLAAAVALFFLLEPGLRQLQVMRVKNRVAVLVDRSASMGFPFEPGGASRYARVAQYLESVVPSLAALKDRFLFETYALDGDLTPVAPEALKAQLPRGARTDLLAAIRAVKAGQGASSRKLSGVVLFSDGADNGELKGGLGGQAASELQALGVPVSTVLVGQDAVRDVALGQVKVDDFAFVRSSITVEIEVQARGYKGRQAAVVLGREGQVVSTQTVTFKSEDDLQTVTFSFTPDQTGRFAYTVNVPLLEEEAVAENNARSFSLKVIRDRIRVLLVVGRPSWDERFLRGRLKQDANVDLVSFYILRTLSDDPNVRNPDRELSLIPFPMEEIFDTKLHTFDVVVFQNFGYTDPQLSIERYEKNLERYVFNGGALVVIGGDHAFGESRAQFPVLGQALPVEPAGLSAHPDAFKPRATPEGLRHPVTALGAGAAATESTWAALPSLPGLNLTRAKPGATVLLDHPAQGVQGKNAPVLALWDYGRGRSLVLTVDASWYWAFPAQAGGAPGRQYDRFWGNALRWLVRDPDLTTLKVTADPPSVEPGRPVAALVTARAADYQPAEAAQVRVDLFSVKAQKVVASNTASTGPDGVARVELPPPEPGEYKLLGSARKGETALGEGEDAVAVRAVGTELSDASVRPELMKAIAERTGGAAIRLPSSGWPDLPLVDPPTVEVGRSRDEPVWDRWYTLAALVAVLGTEWFLRRRFGYL